MRATARWLLVAAAVVIGPGLALLGGCAHDVPPASAAQRARVHVVMYTTRWCPVCSSARRWFRARGIPFEERDVDGSPAAAAAHRQLNPARTVPVIDVEGQVIVGFVADDVRRAVDRAASRN